MAAQPAQVVKLDTTDGVCFRSDDWLRAFTGGMLVREAVLDYFSLSPFYDRSSINEIARTQNLHTSQISAPDRFEYVLHPKEVAPHLFVVCKQQRVSPDAVKVLATYYVLDGTIYPGPLLHAVVSARTLRCMHGVRMAFKALADSHGTGASTQPEQAVSKRSSEASTTTQGTSSKKKRSNAAEERFMDHAIWTALNSTEEFAKEHGLRPKESEEDEGQVKTEDVKADIPTEAAPPAAAPAPKAPPRLAKRVKREK